MKFTITLLTLLLFSTLSLAHDNPPDHEDGNVVQMTTAKTYPLIKVQYGLGLGDISDGEVLNGSERSLNIGYYNKLNKILGWDVHAGMLTGDDVTSYYVFAQFGSELHPFDWMYIDHYFGPGYVNVGNTKISAGLNFSMHMGIGWRDPVKGTTVGMNWKHISNAGLRKPNKGMDFLLVQVGYPL